MLVVLWLLSSVFNLFIGGPAVVDIAVIVDGESAILDVIVIIGLCWWYCGGV